MKKISVIIPVYNVEAYLDRCVESVINQTYPELEIILVDDGSPDNCPALCDAWAEKDSRIKVIHKENGGQADARNVGLSVATGEYIGFVDSDDFISPLMYGELIKLADSLQADVVGCSNIAFSDEQSVNFESDNDYDIYSFSQHEAIEDLIKESHFRSTVWNLLVKAPIAKEVRFDAGKINEDILWPFRVFMNCRNFVFTEKKLYAYFQRPNSTMNSGYSKKRFDALDALETRAVYVRDLYPDLYHLATEKYLGACIYYYQFLCRQPKSKEYDEYKRCLYNRYCDGDKQALFKGAKMEQKIWYVLFQASPNLTCKIRNTLKVGL